MNKKHRTYQRLVAALMLLSFAAMFGAAYLPGDHHENSMSMAASHEMVMDVEMAETGSAATASSHDCCDQDVTGNEIEKLRCSVDCSYYLSTTEFAFHSSSPAFGDGVMHSMFLALRTSFLRPPIA